MTEQQSGQDSGSPAPAPILVLYGSYRSDRAGIRLADFLISALRARGDEAELIDARAINLPMLDRMYKEYPPDAAPAAMQVLAGRIRSAKAFVFVTGEYNGSVQAGLKNLVDHYLEEWFWRPAAIASYSSGRLSGAAVNSAWHPILTQLGMIVISSGLAVGSIGQALDENGRPVGAAGAGLEHVFSRFADDLAWWTQAAQAQRKVRQAPY